MDSNTGSQRKWIEGIMMKASKAVRDVTFVYAAANLYMIPRITLSDGVERISTPQLGQPTVILANEKISPGLLQHVSC